jgi:enoyl-CoA hydratase/carnithine racemase
MSGTIGLDRHDQIAVITCDNPRKHNAFDDAMDRRLFEILAELRTWKDQRAVIWRDDGPSVSSGRDVASIGGHRVDLTHAELMSRGHAGKANIPVGRAHHHRPARPRLPAISALRHPELSCDKADADMLPQRQRPVEIPCQLPSGDLRWGASAAIDARR